MAFHDRHSCEKVLRFDRQVKKLGLYNDLREMESDRAKKWFPDEMLRLMSEERQKGARTKDEIYERIADRIGLSENTVNILALIITG